MPVGANVGSAIGLLNGMRSCSMFASATARKKSCIPVEMRKRVGQERQSRHCVSFFLVEACHVDATERKHTTAQLRMFVHHHDVAEVFSAPQKTDGALRPRDGSVIDQLGQYSRHLDYRADAGQIVSTTAVPIVVMSFDPHFR